jgi:hypothetical protein
VTQSRRKIQVALDAAIIGRWLMMMMGEGEGEGEGERARLLLGSSGGGCVAAKREISRNCATFQLFRYRA